MEENTPISITTDELTLRHALKKLIKSEHNELIAKIIIRHLAASEMGLNDLILSLSGITRHFKYKILDEIVIPYNTSYTWKINKQFSIDAGYIIKGELIKAVIIGINNVSANQYKITYKFVDDKGIEIIQEQDVAQEQIELFKDDLI